MQEQMTVYSSLVSTPDAQSAAFLDLQALVSEVLQDQG
jgi:hypothetical protein